MLWQAQGIIVMRVFLPMRWRVKSIQVDHLETPNAFRYEARVLPQRGTALVQSDEFVTWMDKRAKVPHPLN